MLSRVSPRAAAFGHAVGAALAIAALRQIEFQIALPLLPKPQLGEGVTPLAGACVEGALVAYLLLLLLYLPSWLASRRLPRILFLLFMMPAMRAAKPFTGPALQPAYALALKATAEGPHAAYTAFVPYAVGPLIGATIVGLAHRGRLVPYQRRPGVPLQLLPYPGRDAQASAGRKAD